MQSTIVLLFFYLDHEVPLSHQIKSINGLEKRRAFPCYSYLLRSSSCLNLFCLGCAWLCLVVLGFLGLLFNINICRKANSYKNQVFEWHWLLWAVEMKLSLHCFPQSQPASLPLSLHFWLSSLNAVFIDKISNSQPLMVIILQPAI